MIQDAKIIKDMGLLADATYFELGGPDLYKGAIITSGRDQSILLNNSYTVIDYIDTDTGMQAVLLAKNNAANQPTSEHVIAFRGTETESWNDILADYAMLFNYNPQLSDARDFVQNMIGDYGISTENLTLPGHSLGGILTQAVGADLKIKGYAYNPYGADLINSLPPLPFPLYVTFGQILEVFGIDAANDPWVKDNLLTVSYQDNGALNGDGLSNLLTEFSELVAGNEHLGGVLPVFGDNVGASAGHIMSTLNSAIQHYIDLLTKFSDETTMADISLAYALEGADGYNSAEEIFDDLNVESAVDGSLSFGFFGEVDEEEIVILGASQIKNLAESDIAYRYALLNFNSFAVVASESFYSSHNPAGELDIENFSADYLDDRSRMLELVLVKNSSGNTTNYQFGDMDVPLRAYYDALTETFFYSGSNSPDAGSVAYQLVPDDVEKVFFGDDQSNTFNGGVETDRLYGMAGDDVLKGNDGDDYLEGGSGNDTLESGIGSDELLGGEDNDTYIVESESGDVNTLTDTGVDDVLTGNINEASDTYRIAGEGESSVEDVEGEDSYTLTVSAGSKVAIRDNGTDKLVGSE